MRARKAPDNSAGLCRAGHRERLVLRQIHSVRRLGVFLRLSDDLLIVLTFDHRSARALNDFPHGDLLCAVS